MKVGDLVRWTLPDAFGHWQSDIGIILRFVPIEAADIAWASGYVAWTPLVELEVISEA